MQYVLLSMLIGALLGGGMAVAQSSTEPVKPHAASKFSDKFTAADKDGDGALSRNEAEEAKLVRVVDNFDRIDVNRDGKVTREELRTMVRSRVSI